ncbi:MAG: DUF4968 domain-containing protein [Anaerolineales bacterium]|nr:DUF4968 domain-containing protein [Anaerolineales bacterium]
MPTQHTTFSKALFALRAIGLGPALRTLRYSLLRDRLEAPTPNQTAPAPVPPANRTAYQPIPSGIQVQFDNAEVEIVFLAPNLARLTWQPGLLPIPYAIARSQWPEMPIQYHHGDSSIQISSPALTITVANNGSIQFTNPDHLLLRHDLPPMRQGDSWTLTSSLRPEEHLYGLGERAAPFNLRPGSYRMWNSDPGGSYGPGKDPLYICTPVYWGVHQQGCYAVFFENPHRGAFTFDDHARAQFERGALRYYFISGSPDEITATYTDLTGRPFLPPRWAFGYHQCRWGYHSWQEINEVVAGFEQRDLPLSAIHLDIDYMDGFRVFTFHPQRFADPESQITALAEKNVRVVTILDPGIKQDRQYPLYQEGIKQNAYVAMPNGKPLHGLVWPGWSAYPDFTNPAVRQWWGEQYQTFLDLGVAGFWHDMNEPASFAAWGETSLPTTARHNMEGRGGDHLEAHNLYALLMNRAARDALRTLDPDKRPWLFSRAGWAGLQRYAWNWTGDTATSWASLRQTVATILGLSLSGHSFSGPDIGGFSGDPSAELYLRWFQLSAFLPFFRTHSAVGTSRREPWVYGEPTTSIVRHFLHLRQRLLPYLYTLAWQAHQSGTPPVRPLFWSDPANPALWEINDQFLLGEALLVAPILEEGATSRKLTLPPGDWYHIWDDQRLSGPGQVEIPAPLERIPILVKAGALLPMQKGETLELHLYPPATSPTQNNLYLDAGDGYDEWRLEQWRVARKGDQIKLERSFQGTYPFSYPQIILQPHAIQVRSLRLNGKKHPLSEPLPGEEVEKVVLELE